MIKLRPARDQRSARIASRPIFTAVKIVSSSLEDRRIDGRRFKEEFGEREREKGKKENPARTTAPTGSERRKTTVRTRRRRREEKRREIPPTSTTTVAVRVLVIVHGWPLE